MLTMSGLDYCKYFIKDSKGNKNSEVHSETVIRFSPQQNLCNDIVKQIWVLFFYIKNYIIFLQYV